MDVSFTRGGPPLKASQPVKTGRAEATGSTELPNRFGTSTAAPGLRIVTDAEVSK